MEGSSTDFGVLGREVNLKERLREVLVLGSDADVDVEPFLAEVEDECCGVEVDEEDLRVKEIPKSEWRISLRLMEEGVSERGKW